MPKSGEGIGRDPGESLWAFNLIEGAVSDPIVTADSPILPNGI